MKNPHRPLEAHEISYLLVLKIRPELAHRPERTARPTGRMSLGCNCPPQNLPPGRMALHACEVSELIG